WWAYPPQRQARTDGPPATESAEHAKGRMAVLPRSTPPSRLTIPVAPHQSVPLQGEPGLAQPHLPTLPRADAGHVRQQPVLLLRGVRAGELRGCLKMASCGVFGPGRSLKKWHLKPCGVTPAVPLWRRHLHASAVPDILGDVVGRADDILHPVAVDGGS